MARSPNAAGMFDIRTAAILQNAIYDSDPCVPGSLQIKRMLRLFDEPAIGGRRQNKFDKTKDWLATLASMLIIGTIIGIIQSYILFVPSIRELYQVQSAETVMIGAASYGVLIMLGPVSSCVVGVIGVRITCVFGMLLFFLGLILLALTIHSAVLYVSHILLMGVGGSFAYAAAISSVVDRFRRRLPCALVLLAIASPIGTAGIYGLLRLIFTYIEGSPYEWAMLILAIIVLVLILVTYIFPSRVGKSNSGATNKKLKPRNKKVQECVEKSLTNQEGRNCIPPFEETENEEPSCLCVIVFDVSILSDVSFVLWAIITFFSTLSFFIPYLFLLELADRTGVVLDLPAALIYLLCLGSLLGRLASVVLDDHTFMFNRTIFQICMIGSGIAFIVFIWSNTSGWTLFWAFCIGLVEGVLTTVIPRITLQTVPRKWMSSSWAYIVVLNGVGIITGVGIIVSTWVSTKRHTLGLITIGVAQIIAALLAFLLPNEEPNIPEHLIQNGQSINSFASSELPDYDLTGYKSRLQDTFGPSTILNTREFARNPISISTPLPKRFTNNYSKECPICKAVGCIPECENCTPEQ